MAEQLSHAEVLGLYCGNFVDELAAAGVENVCLCPGSRSTPLALTFARHPGIKLWMHLDERSCAYFALGMAKASGKPSAILCSSGTAAVNFAPAVVEAFHGQVPLIVLTADRPPELQGLGANQTIDQYNLYGPAAKWFVNLPLPEASEPALRYLRMVADRAVSTALLSPRGPVHINAPYREPLIPSPQPTTATRVSKPPQIASMAGRGPRQGELEWLVQEIKAAQRKLVVCGPMDDTEASSLVELVALNCDMVFLADPVSQARCGSDPCAIGLYDNYLRDSRVVTNLRPDFILRFGAPPTSKALNSYLERHSDVRQVVVTGGGAWQDPDVTASAVIEADVAAFCVALVSAGEWNGRESEDWHEIWLQTEEAARNAIAGVLGDAADASEPSALYDLAEVLPRDFVPGAVVVAGNSMPVRDMDSFFSPQPQKGVKCLANRGASGIDGVVSTALGAAAVSEGPTVLVIGDLSFYHDMNGLLAAQRFGLNATIVLINNDGGGIFSFLPQHADAEHFEQLWGTPHGLDFSHVAGLYGVGFQRVTTRREYRDALKASFDAPGVQVIEIRTDREENLKLHQRIWDEVAKAVERIAVS
jgi:2-succinyl-5-enolpyruvyl-6-hydroxy-3-cyclohexene-1-carboxylate synthase